MLRVWPREEEEEEEFCCWSLNAHARGMDRNVTSSYSPRGGCSPRGNSVRRIVPERHSSLARTHERASSNVNDTISDNIFLFFSIKFSGTGIGTRLLNDSSYSSPSNPALQSKKEVMTGQRPAPASCLVYQTRVPWNPHPTACQVALSSTQLF